MITLNQYQDISATTAIYKDKDKLLYTALGLAGEAGEIANKVKKIIRDKDFTGNAVDTLTWEERTALCSELGDVLWYVANFANDLNVTLENIASTNIDKLQSRKERGVLQGSGDMR